VALIFEGSRDIAELANLAESKLSIYKELASYYGKRRNMRILELSK